MSGGFTAGPWHVGVRSTAGETFGVHAEFLAKHVGTAQGQSNANLIAAAPDLYNALQALMANDGARGTFHAGKALEAKQTAERALAKARGEA